MNPRFESEGEFLQQIVAEIGAHKLSIAKQCPHVFWQDHPRPRVYWYDPDKINTALDNDAEDEIETEIPENFEENTETKEYSEQDLYPVLIQYLKSEHKLYCQRIDERRSRNSRGAGGNQWLHPDIVAMHPVAKEWDHFIQACIKQGASQSARLLSYEVKKTLTLGSVRKSYFQAVSNSSWANEGYLVAASIGPGVEHELRMLNALHGIGVILLNVENPSESDMILPARSKTEVDWQSVNRIVLENDDFKDYIELVSLYYQTGNIRNRDWNKI